MLRARGRPHQQRGNQFPGEHPGHRRLSAARCDGDKLFRAHRSHTRSVSSDQQHQPSRISGGPKLFFLNKRSLLTDSCLRPIAALLPSMVGRRSGHIVAISSVQGKIAIPYRSACRLPLPFN